MGTSHSSRGGIKNSINEIPKVRVKPLLLTQKRDYFFLIWEATDIMFGEYEFAVNSYIKDTVRAFDQFRPYAELF